MARFSLRARWVLPIDRPPIEGGYVTIEDGSIVGVAASAPSGALEDLGDAVLMPGLVNAHTHLEFSDLTAPLGQPGMVLPAWIRLVITERKRGNHDAAAAISAGMAESLACGVTTIGEISTAPADAYDGAVLRPSMLTLVESIGFSTQRVESAFADVAQRFDQAVEPAGLSPHAPYTVHPALLKRVVQLAASRGAPVAMHLAESKEELQLLSMGDGAFRELLEERSMWDGEAIPRGTRPLDYLQSLSAAPRALVIHGNYLAQDEIEFLAQHRDTMSVVYCPRTHAYFGHVSYPLASFAEAGVRVVIGTDSRASNPDLDLLADVRCAAALHREVSPDAWLRMATLDAATALGLNATVGSLTAGKRADLIALPCDAAERDPYAGVISGRLAVQRVWLRGHEASPVRGAKAPRTA